MRQTKSPFQRLLIFITVLISIALQYPQPRLDLSYYSELATNYTTARGDVSTGTPEAPLNGITVVITGPTSGLGLGLAKKLHGLGATIIAVGRSATKLAKLSEEVGEGAGASTSTDDNKKRLIPIVADFKDLDSVSAAADEIKSKFKRIDYLVNNAGIHDTTRSSSTPQGYDLVFGVNYLSPFLLTEKLLPNLEQSSLQNGARIIQISSSMHFKTNGSSLVPNIAASLPPSASQPSSSIAHGIRSYGASKLAQIYHSRALARELHEDKNSVGGSGSGSKSSIQIVNVCPSWVATNIAGSFMKNILQLFAFNADGFGIAPILFAMFHPIPSISNEGGERSLNDFVGSCSIFCNNAFFKATNILSFVDRTDSLRAFVVSNVANVLLLAQKFFASVDFRESSDASFNVEYQDALYKWTKDEISEWMS